MSMAVDLAYALLMRFCWLQVAFLTKQFICDFPLQTSWMVAGKGRERQWIAPLAAHAGVHAAFTCFIGLLFEAQPLMILAMSGVDFGVHFVVDRIKASPKMLGRYKMLTESILKIDPEKRPARLFENKMFWNSLGFDQWAHGMTHLAISFVYLLWR